MWAYSDVVQPDNSNEEESEEGQGGIRRRTRGNVCSYDMYVNNQKVYPKVLVAWSHTF